MDLGRSAGHNAEPDVAGPAAGHEPVRATGRVGAHDHRPLDQVSVVAAPVPSSDGVGELGDRSVEHREVIGDVVRSGVARPQQRSQHLASGIGEAEHRVEPEPALVGRCGAGLVLRVDLHQRRVDVQHHRPSGVGGRRASPHVPADRRERGVQLSEHRRCDSAERSVRGRVRRHGPEQVGTLRARARCQARRATTGEHLHRLDQHLPAVMNSCPFVGPRNGRRPPAPRPSRFANDPSACSPTWHTAP